MKKVLVALLVISSILSVTTSKGADESHKGTTIVLDEDNMLVLNTQVDSESVGKLITQARELDRKALFSKKPIYLFLNTPGGEVETGMQLIDALNSLNRPVHTVTLFAASMGFQIVQNLGNRYVTKHGELMSHRAAGGFQGSFGGKSPSQLENRFKRIKAMLDEMDEQTVARTKGKQTLKSYQEAYADELWLTAKNAIKEGYADETVNVQCSPSLQGTDEHSVEFMGMQIKYETDKCPINTGILNPHVSIHTNQGLKSIEEFNAAGGSYGPDCLSLATVITTKLCATDTTLSPEKVKNVKSSFVDQFSYNKQNVIRITY